MAQSAGYKNPLTIPPFWLKSTAEPPLERTKWTAMMEMAILAKDGIDVWALLCAKSPNIEPTEPIYELEINGETEVEKRKRDIRNQE